jgi:hypothetical protein
MRRAALALATCVLLTQSQAPAPGARIVLLYDAGRRFDGVPPEALFTARTEYGRLLRGQVVQQIASQLGPETVVRVGSAGADVRLSSSWVRSRTDIRRAFEQVEQVADPSPIWDGVCAAAAALADARGRRILILVTDGRATGNRFGFADALDRVRQTGTVVHAVRVLPRVGQGGWVEDRTVDPSHNLRVVAKASRGSFIEVKEDRFPFFLGELVRSVREAPDAR